MRRAAWAAVITLVIAAPAIAQYFVRPNLAPQTIIGNPNSVYAPAQAIPYATLDNDINTLTLLTPTLPSSVDLTNLPPQTVVGNGTSSSAALGFITFSQLKTFASQGGLPTTTYNTYDPTNIPGLTMIGNASTTTAQLALPVSLGSFFTVFVSGCANQLTLIFSNSCALISVTNFGF